MLRLENPTLVVSLLFDRHFGSVHSDPVKPSKEALSELVTATQRRFIFLYGLSLCEIALVQFSEPVSPLSFLSFRPPLRLIYSFRVCLRTAKPRKRKGKEGRRQSRNRRQLGVFPPSRSLPSVQVPRNPFEFPECLLDRWFLVAPSIAPAQKEGIGRHEIVDQARKVGGQFISQTQLKIHKCPVLQQMSKMTRFTLQCPQVFGSTQWKIG